ncbi:MAG: hypothetical protein QW362_07395 [Candidatus Caldarchaeum sp.]
MPFYRTRETFDKVVDNSLRYVGGAQAYSDRHVFDLFVMSALLSHEERLNMLAHSMKMRVDGRLFEKIC